MNCNLFIDSSLRSRRAGFFCRSITRSDRAQCILVFNSGRTLMRIIITSNNRIFIFLSRLFSFISIYLCLENNIEIKTLSVLLLVHYLLVLLHQIWDNYKRICGRTVMVMYDTNDRNERDNDFYPIIKIHDEVIFLVWMLY